MRTLDRYIIREILPPFFIALLVFTFILIIPFIIQLAEQMIAKGVPWSVILQLTVTLLPSSVAVTIPMALLIGILVAFGRLSGDREVVVMLACGVSPYRLLQPVLFLGVIAWGATSWVMFEAMPDANQASREITQTIAMDRAEGEVRPRVFFEDFPNMVLYVREVPLNGHGWLDVLAADTSNAAQPVVYLAKRGRMVVDRQAKTIQMVLEDGTRHTTTLNDPSAYEVLTFERTIVSLSPDAVFPKVGPPKGLRELRVEELSARVAELNAQGLSPHAPIMEIHKKFSVPFACFVFAVMGVALGASHRKDGKLASFVLGIGVIFIYYVIMFTAEALAKGHWVPAWIAMWLPNIFLGAAGVFLLVSRARSADQPIRISLPLWLSRKPAALRTSPAAATGPPAVAAPPRRRVVVVLKVPTFELWRPGLLDMYIGKEYLRI
ncbi:MAG: LPS export ABC transporter permease LptF, partial [Vicinamibacterales bacterium]